MTCCAFLKSYDPKNGPFYLNAYSQDPHSPWDRPEFLGRYDPAKIPLPAFLADIPEVRKELAAFYGAMSFTDEALGRIFQTLRATGLDRNTLVIFTTDHGIGFPRAKGTLYDPGLTTAVIFRWPGQIRPGTVVPHLLSNVDLLPTQLDLLGLSVPKQVQGTSFAAALIGGNYVPHEQIFAERNFHDDFDPMRCVRTTRYKLIRNYTGMSRYKIPAEVTEEDTFATLYHHESGKPRPYEELYDLQNDPQEFHNLAADPAYASVLQDLRGRLDRWMNETGDFLRGGGQFIMSPTPPGPAQAGQNNRVPQAPWAEPENTVMPGSRERLLAALLIPMQPMIFVHRKSSHRRGGFVGPSEAVRRERVCRFPCTTRGENMKDTKLLLAVLLVVHGGQLFAADASRPNILFILADDQPYKTVSCYPETPHLGQDAEHRPVGRTGHSL